MMRREQKVNQLLRVLAMRMRERRKSLGLTQEQLAEKSGLTPNYVGKLEICHSSPSFSALVILAEALEVEVHELLAMDADRPWLVASQEVQRVMDSLGEQDAEFILSEFHHFADYIKSLRKGVQRGRP